MRRWIFMAALSGALLAIPMWGQRGGRGGMGGRGGYSSAPRGGSYWAGGSRGAYGYGPYGYPGHYPYYPGRYPYYPGRYPWWGYRGGYGYGWYGYPWASWGWNGGIGWSGAYNQSGWYSDPVTQYPVYVYANPDDGNDTYNQQQEIDRLNDEVARLRAEREPGSAANPVPQPPPKTQIRAATVLVFRDHHTEEIQNYAVVGKTLWVFTEQRARKIPIATLDVPATTKANEDRGIDFRLPGA
jgi:hypothetical protein